MHRNKYKEIILTACFELGNYERSSRVVVVGAGRFKSRQFETIATCIMRVEASVATFSFDTIQR